MFVASARALLHAAALLTCAAQDQQPASLVLVQTRAVQLGGDSLHESHVSNIPSLPLLEAEVPPYAAFVGKGWKQLRYLDQEIVEADAQEQNVVKTCGETICVVLYVLALVWLLDAWGSHEMKGMKESSDYRRDIDGLRSVAVTGVTFFHANKTWCPGGFAGVDMFFVISGYVVTASLVRSDKLASPSSWLEFYVARIKRLVPASWLTTVVTGFLIAIFIPWWVSTDPRYYYLGGCFAAGSYALFSAANILYANMHTSYWASPLLEMNPFTHMWSLGLEEQYYMVYPFVLMAITGGCASMKDLQKSSRLVVFCLCSLILASGGYYYLHHRTMPVRSFFLLQYRFWELAIGGLLFVLQISHSDVWDALAHNRIINPLMQLICVLMGTTALMYPENMGLPLFTRMCMGCFTVVLFIIVGTDQESSLTRFFKQTPLVMLGKISYPVYLWHWPIFTLFRWTVGLTAFWEYVTSMTLILFLGSFSYAIWEQPAKKWRPDGSWKVIVAFVAASSLGLVWMSCLKNDTFGINVRPLCPASSKNTQVSQLALYDAHPSSSVRRGASLARNQCQCVIEDFTYHTPPDGTKKGKSPACFEEHTINDFYLRDDVYPFAASGRDGNYDPDKNRKQFVVIGDSHSLHAAVMLQKVLNDTQNVDCFKYDGCGFTPKQCFQFRDECTDGGAYLEEAKNRVRQVNKGDVVVFANRIYEEFYSSASCMDAYMAILKEFNSIVVERGASMILFGDNPFLKERGMFCVPTWYDPYADRKCSVSLAKTQQLLAPMLSNLSALADELPDTYFFKYDNLMCDDKACRPFIPGTCTLAYYDEGHLTQQTEIYLSHFLCPLLYGNNLV